MIEMTGILSKDMGLSPACQAIGLTRSSLYRWKKGPQQTIKKPRPLSKRRITEPERDQILSVLNSERFCDLTPRQVYATLLDEGVYHCSWRSMYRILTEQDQVTERRRGHRHHHYEKPELLATSENELWSWDISKLKGPVPFHYYYLYVIIDVFSRYVPVLWSLSANPLNWPKNSSRPVARDKTLSLNNLPCIQIVALL